MMRFLLLYSFSIFLVSCTQDCPEQELESKNNPFSNEIIKIDLPESKENQPHQAKHRVIVSVTAEDCYIVDGTSYNFDSLSILLVDKMDQDSLFTIINIRGGKDARYEAIFKLLTFADKHALKPALAYKK